MSPRYIFGYIQSKKDVSYRKYSNYIIDLFFSVRRQELSPFLHNNLVDFALIDFTHKTTPEDLAYFIRHMPILRQLFVFIRETQHELFAHSSYFEDMLPQSIVKFQFSTRLTSIISNNIDNKIGHRFPMKMHNNVIYTIPCGEYKLPWSIPLADYAQSSINETKFLYFYYDHDQNDISVDALKPWSHATRVWSMVKLPSLDLFRRLRTLQIKDADVVHSILPSTLRSLELIGRLLSFSFTNIGFF
jgi:hypothetical protein